MIDLLITQTQNKGVSHFFMTLKIVLIIVFIIFYIIVVNYIIMYLKL